MDRYKPRFDSEPKHENEPKGVAVTLQQRVLAKAMLDERPDGVSRYFVDATGVKNLTTISNEEFPTLVQKFRDNPKDVLAQARLNLLSISRDNRLAKLEKQDRIKRYINSYVGLQVILDQLAFPPDNVLRNFVPSYVPDNLTDMGQNPQLDPRVRSREKIRVDKSKIFYKAEKLFVNIFSQDYNGVSLERWKTYVIKRVAHFVHAEMPYNYKPQSRLSAFGRSVRMDEVYDQKLAQCRHHALMAQVLLQSFGITSRLLKCDVSFRDGDALSPHAANLVRINFKWHLLDTTNPDEYNGQGEIFMPEISERDIDFKRNSYSWRFPRKKNNQVVTYNSRNNMYFKITKDK